MEGRPMATTVSLTLSPGELHLVLVALGQLPYVQVHELIGKIQTEAGPQLLTAAQAVQTAPQGEEWPGR